MLAVVRHLELAAPLGLVDRRAHRGRHAIGVHDHAAFDVPGRAADDLDERALRPQITLLVGVEDRDERHLGEVDPLAQQVHADDDVVHAKAEIAEDLDALEGLDLGVEVVHLDAHLAQVVGEVLGHLLGERGDEGALPALDAQPELGEEVVDLPFRLADLDLRVDEARRPDDLLHDLWRMLELVGTWRRGHVDGLVETLLELLEGERPVVQRAR